MDNKFTELEIDIISKHDYNPNEITRKQILEIKEKELQKCISFTESFEKAYEVKREKLDKIDPTYYIEIVEPEIRKLKQTMSSYNSKQVPINFFEKSFKSTISTIQLKLSYELEARLNYIKMMKKLSNNTGN